MPTILKMEWLHTLLEEGEIYAVGGSVRDAILGRPSEDLDILAVGIEPRHLYDLLVSMGKVHQVGKRFGVFVFVPHGSTVSYEIALPRKETSTGSGHRDFEVQVDANLPVEVDLKRRDFTINAMARSFRDGLLIDPCGGVKDIKNKSIRQVFDNTFEEDPLRMFRACRFAAQLDFQIDPVTFQGMKEHAGLGNTVSAERIFAELEKLLKAKQPSLGFRPMQRAGLMKFWLPELELTSGVAQPEMYHKHDVFNHIMACVDATDLAPLSVRWAALFHDLGKPDKAASHKDDGRPTFYGHEKISQEKAKTIFNRLRAPLELAEKVSIICREHMFTPGKDLSDKALRRLIKRVGEHNVEELILLRRADIIGSGMENDLAEWDELFNRIQQELKGGTFSRENLALDGHDLINEFKVNPGPRMGEILDQLLEKVLDDPGLNNKEQLSELVKEIINESPPIQFPQNI